MPTKQVLFAPDNSDAAYAYEAECSAQAPEALRPWAVQQQDGAGPWFLRQDINANWVVPLYGPPFSIGGVEVAEPESCAALRSAGVIVDAPEWPADE